MKDGWICLYLAGKVISPQMELYTKPLLSENLGEENIHFHTVRSMSFDMDPDVLFWRIWFLKSFKFYFSVLQTTVGRSKLLIHVLLWILIHQNYVELCRSLFPAFKCKCFRYKKILLIVFTLFAQADVCMYNVHCTVELCTVWVNMSGGLLFVYLNLIFHLVW